MFRGKESSNKIELSRLVQDIEFCCFGLPAALGVGGWVDGGVGWLGGAPHTHAHACARTHAHARTCMRGKHDNSMQMAAPIGFGEIPGIPYDVICSCARMRMRVHVGGVHPLTTPTHIHPPPPPPRGGDPRNQSKFNST